MKYKGYRGQILTVDLSTGQVGRMPLTDELVEKYIGGRGLATRILYDAIPAGIDPFSPENKILFITGPAAGTLLPTSARYAVGTKSPLTGTLTVGYSGGHMAPEIKYAGYDGILLTGVSPRPVYLYVCDDRVEIRDAGRLWGLDTFETEEALKRELGPEVQVASIGRAGENLVPMAGIVHEQHVVGRCGPGAIMGHKQVKAVVVRGTGGVEMGIPGMAGIAAARRFRDTIYTNPVKVYFRLPLGVLVLYAFNSSKYLSWPIQGFSLIWFEQAVRDRQLLGALKNSAVIALATTAFSVVIATLFAYGLVRFKFRGKSLLETVNVLAIITYGVVSAVTVKMWFRSLGIPGGIWPTIIGHTTFIMPFAVLPIRDRLLNFDMELEEAAMDLGATRLRTTLDITLPLIVPAILAGALFCFTISLGEFLLSVFLIGNQMTLPVYLYGLMRFTFTPTVFAAATFIVVFPLIAVIVAALFFRQEVQSLY